MTDGLVTVASPRDAEATLAWLEAALAAKGVTIFAKIDQAAAAAGVGLPLGPATVLIFGNPRAGTRLMQIDPRVAIDLPLRCLVWTDAAGTTYLSYNDPAGVAARHGLAPDTAPVIAAMQAMLVGLADGLKAAG